MSFKDFGRREANPRLNKPSNYKPPVVKLAQSPVVARIRKTQFGTSNPMAPSINVKQVKDNAEELFKNAPKLQIKRLK